VAKAGCRRKDKEWSFAAALRASSTLVRATVFRLENGQVWVQSNKSDTLWVPTMENPEVESALRSSAAGSFT